MEGVKRALRWSLLPVGLYLLSALLLFVFAAGIGVPLGGKQQQVANVIQGSPAEAAGLQPGDILQTIDGAVVDADHPARDSIARAGGRPVRVGIERAGRTQEIAVEPRNACSYNPPRPAADFPSRRPPASACPVRPSWPGRWCMDRRAWMWPGRS